MPELINVKYTDMTSYTDIVNGDILGCPIEYHWGDANRLSVMSRSEFFSEYVESLPKGASADSDTLGRYHGYATIKKAFELGMPQVEVIRPRGNWKWQNVAMTTSTPSVSMVDSDIPFSGGAWLEVSLRCPGFLPSSLVGLYDHVGFQVVESSEGDVTINVVGINGSEIGGVIETFVGNCVAGSVIDGQKYFIEDVVNGKSEYISCRYNEVSGSHACHTSTTFTKFLNIGDTTGGEKLKYPTAISDETTESEGNWGYYLTRNYSDFMNSVCTLIVSPTASDKLNVVLKRIAETRKTCQAVYGYPTANQFTREKIVEFNATLPKSQYSLFVAGREKVSLFGVNFLTDCVGGWCGCTANIAKSAKINQLASAFSYGAYSGNLTETLSLTDANDILPSGVISVISCRQGNYIWGTRDQYSRTTSMFARANVMRVCCNLLRNAFPIALDAIHTDAASNNMTKSVFQGRFQSIVDDLCAGGNIGSESKADVMGDINSDRNTQGGKIFNVIFTMYFQGLVEAVNINIVATDTSVTANIE